MVVSLLALVATESIAHSFTPATPTRRRIVLEQLGCYPSQTTLKRRQDRFLVSG